MSLVSLALNKTFCLSFPWLLRHLREARVLRTSVLVSIANQTGCGSGAGGHDDCTAGPDCATVYTGVRLAEERFENSSSVCPLSALSESSVSWAHK